MIKMLLVSFIFIAIAASPAVQLQTVRQMVLDKHLDEAAMFLKDHSPELLKSPENQRHVSTWFRAFQLDSTLGAFEKALEMNIPDKSVGDVLDERLQVLQKAYEKEPYNMRVISFLIPTLWALKKEAQIKEVLDKASKAMPFFPQYRVYQSWLNPAEKGYGDSCDSALMEAAEREFCYYVKVQQRLQNPNITPKDRILKNYLQKTSIPNKHFLLWEKWKNSDEKQKYLSSCQAMSGKSRKTYFLVPDLCTNEIKP